MPFLIDNELDGGKGVVGGHDVWIKRMRKVTQGMVNPHHADFIDNTMNGIEEDVRMWDDEIMAMLCMIRKVNTTNYMSLDVLGRYCLCKLTNQFDSNH